MLGIVEEANNYIMKKLNRRHKHERIFYMVFKRFGFAKSLEKIRVFLKKSVDRGRWDVVI